MTTLASITKALLLAAALAAPSMCQCMIYGSSQPDAIPDDKAYGLMLSMLMPVRNETPAHNQARVTSYLALIGLNANDQAVFRVVLSQYGAMADGLDQQIKTANGSNAAANLFTQRVALAARAHAAIQATLSPEGVAAVAKHINARVKPRTIMQCPK